MPLFHNISNHSQRKNIVELSEENEYELFCKNRIDVQIAHVIVTDIDIW